MTARKSISTTKRVKIFDIAKGVCHLCGLKIQAGEPWEVSHPICIAIGGADDETNMLPAHKSCHRQHTSQNDAPMIAKVKRQRAKHIGAFQRGAGIQSRGFSKAPPQNRATGKVKKWRGYGHD